MRFNEEGRNLSGMSLPEPTIWTCLCPYWELRYRLSGRSISPCVYMGVFVAQNALDVAVSDVCRADGDLKTKLGESHGSSK